MDEATRAYEARKKYGKPFDEAQAAISKRKDYAEALAGGLTNEPVIADILCAKSPCRKRVGQVFDTASGPLLTFQEPSPLAPYSMRKAAREGAAPSVVDLRKRADLLAAAETGEMPIYFLWCPTHEILTVDGVELLAAIREHKGRLNWRATLAFFG